MPSIAVEAKNTMLSALSIGTLSLHSAYSATGANELTGGSPVYARQVATFLPPIAGQLRMSASVQFDVPDSSTVAWLGFWNGTTFMGMAPNGTSASPEPFIATSTNTMICLNHGFTTDSSLVVWGGSTAVLPATLNEGTVYYVTSASTDTLEIAASVAGTPINVTGGAGYMQGITVLTYVNQGTFTVLSLIIDLTLVA